MQIAIFRDRFEDATENLWNFLPTLSMVYWERAGAFTVSGNTMLLVGSISRVADKLS